MDQTNQTEPAAAQPIKHMNTVKLRKSHLGRNLVIGGVILLLLPVLAGSTIIALNSSVLRDSSSFKKLFQPTAQQEKDAAGLYTSSKANQPTGNVVELVSKTSPAVVTVVSAGQSANPFNSSRGARESESSGTGFFISELGLLITNEHVVCGITSPSDVKIITLNNKTYTAKNIARDPVQDIAIIQVDTQNEKVPFLKFANVNTKIMPGEDVIAIGNPLGVNPGSVTRGIVSGLNRNITAQGDCLNKASSKDYEGVIQTDAAINPGNSGGPLLNTSGDVIGINSATSPDANGISYTVPFDKIIHVLDNYNRNGNRLIFPFLGVEYSMLNPNVAGLRSIPGGAFIRNISPNGPALSGGLKKGDIITKVGNHKVEFTLAGTLNAYFQPGQKVTVEYFRPDALLVQGSGNVNGKNLSTEIILGERAQ